MLKVLKKRFNIMFKTALKMLKKNLLKQIDVNDTIE